MVCAIDDWFAHGETEFSFLTAEPNETWRTVRENDSFQVSAKHSDVVEAALSALGGWTVNRLSSTNPAYVAP